MGILALIFTPQFFVILLGALTTLSVVVALYGLEYDRRYKKLKNQLREGQAINLQLHEKVGQLEARINRLNDELAVKSQMYEGLKDQYDELEKEFEKINDQAR